MSSARLPGKVLRPLGDATVLDQVVRRAGRFSDQVVVCTSVDESDAAIAAHCARIGVVCVRGPLDDVFGRFRLALADPRVRPSTWFARVTADCPLLSVDLAERIVAAAGDELDYVCVELDQLPRGLPIELVRRSRFCAIDMASLDGPEREHVTPRFYENPHEYGCLRLAVPDALRHPELRLTLDYDDDYELLLALFAEDPDVTAEQAVARLLRDPELARTNQHCTQRQVR